MNFPGLSRLADLENVVSLSSVGEFRVVQGRAIHFRSQGEGRTIIFLHGMAASSFSFRDLTPELLPGFRLLAIDLNGFGFSERASDYESYGLAAQAEAIHTLLVELGVEKVILVGHSLGCAVSTIFANRFPESVDRLFLVSPVVEFAKAPWYFRNGLSLRLLYGGVRLLLSSPEKFRKVMGRAFYRNDVLTKKVSEEYRKQLLVNGLRDAFYGYAIALSGDRQLSDAYACLGAPVEILGGEEDAIVSADSLRRLTELIPQTELSLLPDCGHSAPEEFPEKVAEWILHSLSARQV